MSNQKPEPESPREHWERTEKNSDDQIMKASANGKELFAEKRRVTLEDFRPAQNDLNEQIKFLKSKGFKVCK
jgi:hypothetical protein